MCLWGQCNIPNRCRGCDSFRCLSPSWGLSGVAPCCHTLGWASPSLTLLLPAPMHSSGQHVLIFSDKFSFQDILHEVHFFFLLKNFHLFERHRSRSEEMRGRKKQMEVGENEFSIAGSLPNVHSSQGWIRLKRIGARNFNLVSHMDGGNSST